MSKKAYVPKDMTVGKPWKSIILFMLPMLIGNVAQLLYSTVDSIVVGMYIGDNALAAIGIITPVLSMILMLFSCISSGANVMVSQYFGAKNRKSLSYTIGNSITLSAFVSIFLMFVVIPIVPYILSAINTPDSIFKDCQTYLIISITGVLGIAYYNMLGGILRGMGDSVSALIYLLVATILNIVLDIFFVKTLNMGVGGVALATVIAQLISAILCFVRLLRMKENFEFGWGYLLPKKKYIASMTRLGVPSAIAQMINMSAVMLGQALSNKFGEIYIAATVILMRVDSFAMLPNYSFGTTLATYSGQNVGAGRYDRVEKGVKQGLFMALVCAVSLTGILLLFGENIIGIFTDTEEIIDLTYYFLKILAVGYVVSAIIQVLSGVLCGSGDSVTPMWISLAASLVVYLPTLYGISYFTRTPDLPNGRIDCVQIALLSSWISSAIITLIFYIRGKWKTKAIG